MSLRVQLQVCVVRAVHWVPRGAELYLSTITFERSTPAPFDATQK